MAGGFVTISVADFSGVARSFKKWSSDGTINGDLYDVYVDPNTLSPIDPTSTVSVDGGDAVGAIPAKNPICGGVLARTSPQTAVANGQMARLAGSIYGETLAIGALREMKVRQKSIITNTSSAVNILTADASYKLDLYGLILNNRSATDCYVTIKDDTDIVAVINVPKAGGPPAGFTLTVDSAIPQTAINKAWTATCSSASIDSVEITALAVKHL
jgi:hypothetical protein